MDSYKVCLFGHRLTWIGLFPVKAFGRLGTVVLWMYYSPANSDYLHRLEQRLNGV